MGEDLSAEFLPIETDYGEATNIRGKPAALGSTKSLSLVLPESNGRVSGASRIVTLEIAILQLMEISLVAAKNPSNRRLPHW